MTEHDTPQQLTLLPSSDVPIRFRIDAETRRRGIRHIAEIRQQLADRQSARSTNQRYPARRPDRPTAA
jgi:hypothetical protein